MEKASWRLLRKPRGAAPPPRGSNPTSCGIRSSSLLLLDVGEREKVGGGGGIRSTLRLRLRALRGRPCCLGAAPPPRGSNPTSCAIEPLAGYYWIAEGERTWWRRWDSNPRPESSLGGLYVYSLRLEISLLTLWKKASGAAASLESEPASARGLPKPWVRFSGVPVRASQTRHSGGRRDSS